MEFLESLSISHYYFYIKLGISLLLLLSFILFRKLMHRVILKFFNKEKSKFPEIFDDFALAIEKPLDYLWIVTGIYFAFLSSPFIQSVYLKQPPLHINETLQIHLDFIALGLLNQLYGALFIIAIIWGSYNFVDIYEKILLTIGTRFTLMDNALIIRFTSKIIKFLILIIGIGLVTAQFVDIASIITSVGIAGAAFTFIAKDTLTNILSGIVLMIDKPFTIGDWIQVGGIEGTVEDVSFRSTRIRTFEQGLIVMPNTTLSNDNILNWSLMPKRRSRFSFGLTYDTTCVDIEAFVATVKNKLASYEAIEKDTILVYFDNFGNFSLNLIIQYFTSSTDLKGYTSLKEKVNLMLLDLANTSGIDIAFPTQTLKVETIEDHSFTQQD